MSCGEVCAGFCVSVFDADLRFVTLQFGLLLTNFSLAVR